MSRVQKTMLWCLVLALLGLGFWAHFNPGFILYWDSAMNYCGF